MATFTAMGGANPCTTMNSILALTHFCEIHGPQTILATRLAPPGSSSSSSPLPVSETGTSCANCSYNIPHTPTTPVLRSVSENHTLISSRVTSDPLLSEACVRALSVETLGKGQQSGSFTVHTDVATCGNTESRNLNIVHVFRIADPKARGQRRVYAFIAIGDASLWRHQHLFHRTFERWARSIEQLSELQLRELRHRQFAECLGGLETPPLLLSGSLDLTSATPSPPLSLETPPEHASPPKFPSPLAQRHQRVSNVNGAVSPAAQRSMTPVSSFLSAKTVDPDGYPRSSLAGSSNLANLPKTRTLAEIMGDEFFFVRLHAELCGLLREVIQAGGTEEFGDEGLESEDGRVGSGSEDGGTNGLHGGSDSSGEYVEDGDDIMGSWDRD